MATVEVNSEMVMALRAKTGSGIMDCKRAIQEAGGDMEKAAEDLRKKGLADLAKRASKIMKEGIVAVKISPDGRIGVMAELDCETDFVARNPEFRAMAETIASAMLTNDSIGDPAADAALIDSVTQLAAKMGENIQLRRGVRYGLTGPGAINYYLHTDIKKAALVELAFGGDSTKAGDELKNIARELALQAVAMYPRWLRREDVPAEVIEKEKEIYRANPRNQGKSAQAVEKMLEGRIKKFSQDNCLLEQASVRDQKLTVCAMLDQVSARLGASVTAKRFVCYHVGVE
ncbi:MAG: translation elongation factor Ts [bacterium]